MRMVRSGRHIAHA